MSVCLREIMELQFFKRDGAEALTEEGREKHSKALFLVKRLIRCAVEDGATDIHFEPEEKAVLVRYRIDGVLRDIACYDKKTAAALVSCIKIAADLDITQRKRFQDGGFRGAYEKEDVEFRISTVRDVCGDKMVLRILRTSPTDVSLDKIGLSKEGIATLREFVARQQGVLLISGPTGSGKTTTLYTVLKEVDRIRRNVLTVEDPVEYHLDHTTQIEIDPDKQITFGAALRSSMRQDTNVIMIGEVRDEETAVTAIHLAFSGHLVLSSIHARNASAIVYRLLDLGIEPYLLASALHVLMNQRLVRRLCQSCCLPVRPDSAFFEQLGLPALPTDTIYEPCGCKACGGTGYKGRTGIFELLKMTPELRDAIMNKLPQSKFERIVSQQFQTFLVDGINKVARGETSLAEVVHVAHSI
ncbi:MAG: GspE/PulE family protein [Planctomycetota bacterium]|nr:GspE/PulE family protein [Planctomycetota bacterium]